MGANPAGADEEKRRRGSGAWIARPTGTIGKVTGGWQIAGITYLRTGQPFSVAFNTALADILRNPNLSRSERNEYRWFDTSAFAVPREFT